jgi:hypothetical protein
MTPATQYRLRLREPLRTKLGREERYESGERRATRRGNPLALEQRSRGVEMAADRRYRRQCRRKRGTRRARHRCVCDTRDRANLAAAGRFGCRTLHRRVNERVDLKREQSEDARDRETAAPRLAHTVRVADHKLVVKFFRSRDRNRLTAPARSVTPLAVVPYRSAVMVFKAKAHTGFLAVIVALTFVSLPMLGAMHRAQHATETLTESSHHPASIVDPADLPHDAPASCDLCEATGRSKDTSHRVAPSDAFLQDDAESVTIRYAEPTPRVDRVSPPARAPPLA